MKIIPYERQIHENYIEKMLISRFMASYLIQDLPEHGLIALQDDTPIAVGFIRQIEGPYAMLDSYLSNSEADPEIRDRALNLITRKLLDWARIGGVRNVLAFSADPNTVLRAEAHGFVSFKDHTFQLVRVN